ncbi:MAG: hypothetical protein NWF00_07925 [Candidatus Bathyarchaeota archaeon]|nr:hypothetical protein [Candidatus Bathyarchaeota archaeon]
MLEEIQSLVLEHGFYDESSKMKLAGVNIGVFLGTQDEQNQEMQNFVNQLRLEGTIGNKPVSFVQPRLFFGKIPGSTCLVMDDSTRKTTSKDIEKILRLKDMLYRRGLLLAMVHNLPAGTEVRFEADGIMDISYPEDFSGEALLEKKGFTSRSLDADCGIWDWTSDFQEIMIETLRTIDKGKGKQNIVNLQKESEEIFKGFNMMEGFPQTFLNLYSVDLSVFSNMVYDLVIRCYYNVHTVGIWSFTDLLNDRMLVKKYGLSNLRKVLELLCSNDTHLGLIRVNGWVMTNFKRLSHMQFSLLEKCFYEAYDNNLKGVMFEEGCRKMLQANGFLTFTERVVIAEPFLPEEVSVKLWGKIKRGTDVDVIACNNQVVLVIECKEAKWTPPSISTKNLMTKYSIEHFYRAKWVCANFHKIRGNIRLQRSDNISEKCKNKLYFFPLLVSNIVTEIKPEGKAPLVTFTELKEITAQRISVNDYGDTGVFKTIIGRHQMELPWFVLSID